MKSLVSIMIPVYNAEKYLRRCLDSLLAQTFTDWEMILVDDGSTDSSSEICKGYAELDDRIHYYYKDNGGPSSARNYGLQKASGDWLLFVDSDDFCESVLLERAYQRAVMDQADMTVFGYLEIHDTWTGQFHYGRDDVIDAETFLRALLLSDNLGNYIMNKLYRRKLFDGITFPEGEIFEDISTLYKVVMRADRIAVIDRCMYQYYKHAGSVMDRLNEKQLGQLYRAVKRRNRDTVQRFPALVEDTYPNQLRYDIYIWNQLAKWDAHFDRKKYAVLVREVRRYHRYLKLLPKREHGMGIVLAAAPGLYTRLIHLIEKGRQTK